LVGFDDGRRFFFFGQKRMVFETFGYKTNDCAPPTPHRLASRGWWAGFVANPFDFLLKPASNNFFRRPATPARAAVSNKAGNEGVMI